MEEELDKNKLKQMLNRIIELERKNANTKDFNDNEVIHKIEKIIKEEGECF